MILYWILALTTYGAVLCAVGALALALLRKWKHARNFARVATFIALFIFGLTFVSLALLLVIPSVGTVIFRALLPAGDPADRAQFLGEAIAETINSSAMAVPTLLLAVPIWILARHRLAKQSSEA